MLATALSDTLYQQVLPPLVAAITAGVTALIGLGVVWLQGKIRADAATRQHGFWQQAEEKTGTLLGKINEDAAVVVQSLEQAARPLFADGDLSRADRDLLANKALGLLKERMRPYLKDVLGVFQLGGVADLLDGFLKPILESQVFLMNVSTAPSENVDAALAAVSAASAGNP